MSNYYIITANNLPEYASIDTDSVDFRYKNACIMCQHQHIDIKNPTVINVDTESGDIYPDLIYNEGTGIPLVSDRFKNILDDFEMEYILFSKVILYHETLRREHECWLMLPPKIDCLDYEKSEISEHIGILRKAVIDERTTGRFNMFKICDKRGIVISQKLFITEELVQYLKKVQEDEDITLKNVIIKSL
ncbi:MAG: hypothetical protein K2J36_08285 [Ruminococcus sp.]|nr:hypothetical protein [Ruminococcus sp.]